MLIDLNIDPADANSARYALTVTGAVFVLTNNDTGDNLAHRVSIKNNNVTDHTDKTLTLVGLDADGKAQTEVITAPGSSLTIQTIGYFLRLDSITPSATIGTDTFRIGSVNEVAERTLILNWQKATASSLWEMVFVGVANASVQFTLCDVENTTLFPSQEVLEWSTHVTGLTNETANILTTAEAGFVAARVVVNSYDNGAEIKVRATQAE